MLIQTIHEIVRKNKETLAMSVRKNSALIKIGGVALEETRGIVGKSSEILGVNGINIYGILTITSSILLFVDWSQKEKALKLIKGVLK